MLLLFLPKSKVWGLLTNAETRRKIRHEEAFHSLSTVLGLRKWNALGLCCPSVSRMKLARRVCPTCIYRQLCLPVSTHGWSQIRRCSRCVRRRVGIFLADIRDIRWRFLWLCLGMTFYIPARSRLRCDILYWEISEREWSCHFPCMFLNSSGYLWSSHFCFAWPFFWPDGAASCKWNRIGSL